MRLSSHRASLLAAVTALLFVAADWARFRGPDGRGLSDDASAPTTWSQDENVVWKTPLPGFGASSPIAVGDRVFVTCYSGYGLDADEPGDPENLQHSVLCLGLADGKVLWAKAARARLPEKEYTGFIPLHGYASGTPTSDGQAVYAFFGRSGVLAYTIEGEPFWRAYVGDGTHEWGSGASPILYRHLLIVNASVESQSLVALDKATGKEIWRLEGIRESWTTPLVVDLPDGSQELVLSARDTVLGVDPATGNELWRCGAVRDYVVPSLVAHNGVIYVSGGIRPQTLAIRAGGRGDVTGTHVLWEIKKGSKVPTPLYHDGYLYWTNQQGVAACVKAETGEVVYEHRLEDLAGRGDKVYASEVLVGGRLYVVTRQSGTVVLSAGTEYKELARNTLNDPSIFNATPVPLGDGRMLLRSDRFLYCVGK